jgi:hypothetical protein
MIRTTTQNEALKKILDERESILSQLIDTETLDDEKLSRYKKFQDWYSSLSQLDKDLYYLLSLYPVRKVAHLFDCSVSYVYKKKKALRYE